MRGADTINGKTDMGSSKNPFPCAQAILDFLKRDNPQRYVFRGQTRCYPGPLIPSSFRNFFKPFEGESMLDYAGITWFTDEIRDEFRQRYHKVQKEPPYSVWPDLRKYSGKIWSINEDRYEAAFRIFYGQPVTGRQRSLAVALLRNSARGLIELFGGDLGNLLSQQYGFTSNGLDATTSPDVAIYFATHESPFYQFVGQQQEVGVVYRWAKESAMIAEEISLPLEDKGFKSVTESMKNFIERSVGLGIACESTAKMEICDNREIIHIKVKGPERDFNFLRFPHSTYVNSRMGRQRAAILWPKCEPAYSSFGSDLIFIGQPQKAGMRLALLVGDILKTYGGEAFYFRQTSERADLGDIDKFYLWPAMTPKSLHLVKMEHGCFSIMRTHFDFEDRYLEMMLRFFSTCSPARITVFVLGRREECDVPIQIGDETFIYIGETAGVVNLGYTIHPAEAERFSRRFFAEDGIEPLKESNIGSCQDISSRILVPEARYLLEEHEIDFRKQLSNAIAKFSQGFLE